MSRLIWTFLFTIICSVLFSCSSARRHEVLDFFFDGVPPLASEGSDSSATTTQRENGPTRYGVPISYEHPPHADGLCDACHSIPEDGLYSGNTSLLLPADQLCFECHDDFSIETLREENGWVHGPVAAGQCIACHSPHKAAYPSLLRQASREEICSSCHKDDSISPISEHQQSGSAICLDCHWPHAGPGKVASIPAGAVRDSLQQTSDPL